MPRGDGTGPGGAGPGTGRRLGGCFSGPGTGKRMGGTGKRMGGTGIGAAILAFLARDVSRPDSLIRTGFARVLDRFSSRTKAVRGPGKPDRDKIVNAEYGKIAEVNERRDYPPTALP